MNFDELKAKVIKSWDAQRKWRESAREEFDFVNGHQWTASEKADLEEDSRLPIVFNRVAPILASVAGTEINNRTEVRFIPREIGDSKPNEVLTAGAEWFRDQADAEDEESVAFMDSLICGIGATETLLDFEEDEEGAPGVQRIEPFEVFWDCHVRRKGIKGGKMAGRVRSLPLSEAREMFPDAKDEDFHAAWLGRGESDHSTNETGDEYGGDSEMSDEGIPTDGMVSIVQVQWQERVRAVEFIDDMGERQETSKKRFDAMTKGAAGKPVHRVVTRKEWKQAFMGANGFLRQNQPDKGACTINFITGHWDRKDKRFFGLLRSMIDPQKYANKWLSQTLHIIASNAKGGVIAEEGAVDNHDEFETSWAKADAITWVKSGQMGKIVEKSGPQMPSSTMNLTEFAISSIRDVSGVNLEIMGMREANQPGVLEYQRRQSAMTTLATFFDALRFYRKMQGEVILHFLRDHIAPTGRLVRIVKDGDAKYVKLAMDEGVRNYDVIVDEAASAPNEKEKGWSVIQAMMPMLQNAGLSMEEWADIMEYSPLPSSFVEKMREKAAAQKQQGPDPMQELEIAKIKSEISENESNARLDAIRAQEIQQEANLRPIETAINMAGMMGRNGMPQV